VSEDDECSFQPCCEAEEILGYEDESRYSGCDGAALPAGDSATNISITASARGGQPR